jgi:hypothetical protein
VRSEVRCGVRKNYLQTGLNLHILRILDVMTKSIISKTAIKLVKNRVEIQLASSSCISFFFSLVPFILYVASSSLFKNSEVKVAGSIPDEVIGFFNFPAALWPWGRLRICQK